MSKRNEEKKRKKVKIPEYPDGHICMTYHIDIADLLQNVHGSNKRID